VSLLVRLLGVPVRIHAWFLITPLLVWDVFGGAEIGWEALPIAALVAFQAVLTHELGHAWMGKRFGLEPRVELFAPVGHTRFRATRPVSPRQGMAVSLAGPMLSILVGAPALALLPLMPSATPIVWFAVSAYLYTNLGWGLLNLVPVLPLDAGHVLAAALQSASKKKRGLLYARVWSALAFVGVAVTAVVFGEYEWALVAALFVVVNGVAIRAEHALRKATRDAPSAEDVVARTYRALEEGDAQAVTHGAALLLRAARDDASRDEALHLLAWGQLLMGEAVNARAALDELSGERDPDPALDGAVHLGLGRPRRALDCFEEVLGGGPSAFVEKRLVEAVEKAGDWDRASTLAEEHGEHLRPQTILQLQVAALQAGRPQVAMRLGVTLFERSELPLAAFNVACALARSGRDEEALGWIEQAREAGFADTRLLDDEDDLEGVRALPGWEALRARFEAT